MCPTTSDYNLRLMGLSSLYKYAVSKYLTDPVLLNRLRKPCITDSIYIEMVNGIQLNFILQYCIQYTVENLCV